MERLQIIEENPNNRVTVDFNGEQITRSVRTIRKDFFIKIKGNLYPISKTPANITEPKTETKPVINFDINKRFGILERFTNMVIKNTISSSIICGEGGLGKSHTVLTQLNKANLKEGSDYVIVKGYSTPKALYRTLFENLDKLVVFDDCDSVLKDANSVNLLKGALDTYDKRTVSWLSQGFIDDGLPESFDFEGRIIFISNLPMSKIDQAVKSRAMTVDLSMNNEEKITRMTAILEDVLPEYSIEMKRTVLAWLDENKDIAKQLNIRTLQNLIKIYDEFNGDLEWEDAALYLLVNV